MPAVDQGDEAAQWLCQVLQASKLRLAPGISTKNHISPSLYAFITYKNEPVSHLFLMKNMAFSFKNRC